MQNNNIVLDQIIDSNENLIYSSQSYQKEIVILDRNNFRLLLSMGLPLLINIPISLILFVLGRSTTGLLSEFSIFHSFLIISFGTFIGYFLIGFITDIIHVHRESLKNTDYYITDHRIISISTYDHKEYLIITLSLDKIHSFYIKSYEGKTILYFKTETISDEEMNNCFQIAKPSSKIENKIIPGLDTEFKLPEKEFLLIWKNVENTEITEILSQYLPNKQKSTPIDQSKVMTIEAHIGG